ncbi:glycoside hydrolase domain-containing protein [Goodfellowiella coeruleoviolacea]|uniref:Rv2525c-like glycoside hydrolase-like domain-containing protein n=1 Tax=Goodfellowiella coeruleoviolacea TaxID=334858 RepID=A0AAE3GBW3_9PSEU|nr:glycoside hydrolase domain-containing protein [Goodfellowiella coeruleoviolacea]MCP2165437.1 protein of unknown function (DUF1906) [Goodfellowiella coeruleoviolacea]
MKGLDYSTGPPSAAAVRAAGYEFVVRYVSRPGNPKNITAREFADMTNNGVAVALVFETTANRALSGYAGGQADAQSAADQAAGVGMPGSRPIYFAVDFDAQPNQFGTIDDYLRGAASVVGIDRVGVYGSFSVVGHCLDVGTARYAWQTAAWSGGQADLRAHLFQRRGTVYVGGIACDVNDSNASDFGQWPYEEDDMPLSDEDVNRIADASARALLNFNCGIPEYLRRPGDGETARFEDLTLHTNRGVFTVYDMVVAYRTAFEQLADAVAKDKEIDAAAIKQAVTDAIKENVLQVDLAIRGKQDEATQ